MPIYSNLWTRPNTAEYARMCRSRAVLVPRIMVSSAVVVSWHAASTGTRNLSKRGGRVVPVVHVDDAPRRGCETGDEQVARVVRRGTCPEAAAVITPEVQLASALLQLDTVARAAQSSATRSRCPVAIESERGRCGCRHSTTARGASVDRE